MQLVCQLIIVYLLNTIQICDGGQTCASCSESENEEPCQHFIACGDDEECYVHNYTSESGYDYRDYGCISTQACSHQLGPIIGKRAEGRHVKCMACCNETQLCNLQLNCDISTSAGVQLPRDCSGIPHPNRQSGSHVIYPYGVQALPVTVFCEFDSSNNAWTVVQRRFDGSVYFYQNWSAYKKGFGTSTWIGNEILHQLTSHVNQELKIVLSDFQNVTKYADYTSFHVADESSGYRLTIGGYSGNAGDAMAAQNGMKFSTFDRDNDASTANCAQLYKGGWWYAGCHQANLNGLYLSGAHASYADGIEWGPWHGHYYSLKTTAMLIKNN